MSTAYNRRRGASADKPRPTHHQKLDPLVVEEPAAPVVSIDFGAVAPRTVTKTGTKRSRSKAYAQHNEQVRCHRQRRKSRKQRKTTQKMKHRVWSR